MFTAAKDKLETLRLSDCVYAVGVMISYSQD